MAAKAPRVVAELGRPETPEETAARKAENSRRHRANQTMRNLVASLVVTVVVAAALVAIVVRPDGTPPASVDWHTIASQAGEPVLDPQLPAGWSSNAAEFRGDGDTSFWYIGFVTPDGAFLALEEHATADPSLVKDVLVQGSTGPTTTSAGGLAWSAYAAPAGATGDYTTVWESQGTTEQIMIYGTADADEFSTFADAVGEAAQ